MNDSEDIWAEVDNMWKSVNRSFKKIFDGPDSLFKKEWKKIDSILPKKPRIVTIPLDADNIKDLIKGDTLVFCRGHRTRYC